MRWCSRRRSRWKWPEETGTEDRSEERAGAKLGRGGKIMLQLISLLMENKPGALMRVTGLLSSRGYNIESLTVARTLDPELSRMSIVVDVEPTQRTQVIKQMNKLVNVLQAVDLTEGAAVRRELVLVRVRSQMQNRTAILKEAEIFGARAVDSSVEGFALEATGDPEKLDEFIDVMRSYGEIEVTRSGLVAVSLENKKLKLAPPVHKDLEVESSSRAV
jgi:acetolactate synthase-1/3 small subunit